MAAPTSCITPNGTCGACAASDEASSIIGCPHRARNGWIAEKADRKQEYFVEKGHTSKNQLSEQICSLLGGRAAEQLTQDDVCTGASNDIERATSLARQMITKFGMSDRLGLVTYGHDNNEVFLGRDFSSTPNYSEKTAAAIDEEIEAVVMKQYAKALELLNNAMPKLHAVAKVLFEKEKISGDEFRAIMEQ